MVKCFYEPVLYGITVGGENLAQFSPVIGFSMKNYVDVDFVYDSARTTFNGFIPESWLYALLTALVGLAFMTAALFMYRSRKLESAGDFIAFKPASPVFLILYSLCAGAALYLMGEAAGTNLQSILLVIGLALGWFTGLMLLQKRVNIFRWKAFIGFGILIFTFFLSVTVVWLDPVGVTRYVPQADQVQKVAVSPYTSDYYYNQNASLVTDPADIERLTQIHQNLITTRDESHAYPVFRIRYTLKTGVEVERTYLLDANSTDGQWMKKIYSGMDTVLGGNNLERLKQTVRFAELYYFDTQLFPDTNGQVHFEIKREDWDGLLDALAADCAAGNMAQIWDYHQDEAHVASLNIQIGGYSHKDIMIYESCTNTLTYLKTLATKLETTE